MAEECEEYVKDKMKIVPRFLKPVCEVNPEAARRFADFYESIWGEKDLAPREEGLLEKIKGLISGEEEYRALDRKTKELIFTALGSSTSSPRCLIHVIPAIEAGASDEEILEATSVGFVGSGFYPFGTVAKSSEN